MRSTLLLSAVAARAAADVLIASVAQQALTPPLPTDFVGFSIETMSTLRMIQQPGTSNARTSFVNLMRNLAATSSGAAQALGPNLRVGGSSADGTIYGPPGTPLPPNITYLITDADLAAYRTAVTQWGGTVTVDVNFALGAYQPQLGAAHIAAAVKVLGWVGDGGGGLIDGIELGNEPDLYHDYGKRPHDWSLQDYYVEFGQYVANLTAAGVLPSTPAPHARALQGATYCCYESTWGADLSTYAAQYGSHLRSISYHRYPDTNNANASLAKLLSDQCAAGAAASVANFSAAAAAAGIPFFIGEGNSVNNGGIYGISNTMGSALWAVDVLTNMAAIGAMRWNFHGGPGGAYCAICEPSSGDVPDVRPLYYGLWLFSTLIGNSSTLRAVNVTQSSNGAVKVWAAIDGVTGATRVAVLHKDMNAAQPANVTISLPAGAGSHCGGVASLRRLVTAGAGSAPGNASATYGLSFGGQTFDGSTDGLPVGPASSESVPSEDGSDGFAFTVWPISAVLLSC